MPRRDDQQIERLYADFWHRGDALPGIFGLYLGLPGLRGFWPLSSFNESGNAYDLSEQGRILTLQGNTFYSSTGLAPYASFDGTGDYLYRADEAGLDILGTETFVEQKGITFGGWFYPKETGTLERLMAKANAGQLSYALYLSVGDLLGAFVSDNGVAITDVNTDAAVTMNAWYCAIARFYPSSSMDLFVNGEWYTEVSAMASIFNGNADFCIGAQHAGGNPFNGLASLCFLCCTALSDERIESLFDWTRALFGV